MIQNQQPPKVRPLHVNLPLFWRPPYSIPLMYVTMIIWSTDHTFVLKLSSKSTVTIHLQKVWPLHVNLPLFWRPPYSTPLMYVIMIIWSTDHTFVLKLSSKSTVTIHLRKVWPLHVNLPLFWRPPIAHSTSVTSFLYTTVTTHTHNSNHLEPLDKNRKPPARFARFGG